MAKEHHHPKIIRVGIKHPSEDIEFKTVDISNNKQMNDELNNPPNIYAFGIPYLPDNIIMFSFESDEYQEHNSFGLNTPILFMSRVNDRFTHLTAEDELIIIDMLNNTEIQSKYREGIHYV